MGMIAGETAGAMRSIQQPSTGRAPAAASVHLLPGTAGMIACRVRRTAAASHRKFMRTPYGVYAKFSMASREAMREAIHHV